MKPTDVRKQVQIHALESRTDYVPVLAMSPHTHVVKSKLSACLYTDSSFILFSSNDAAISALNRAYCVS